MPRRKLPPIEIRDSRIRGGRLSLAPRTDSPPVWRRRETAVRKLVEDGETEIIERLRTRKVHIADVTRAVETGDLSPLRASASHSLRLGDVMGRHMERVDALLEPSTVRHYQTLNNQLIARWGADRDISSVTTADVENYLHESKGGRWKKNGKPWSGGRQLVMRVIGGAVWERELEREREAAGMGRGSPRMAGNPWKKAETKGARRPRVAWLRPAEWAAVELYLHSHHPDRLALFALGALAGLRLGEALHLRTGIDLAGRSIHVQPRTGEHAWRPKNRLGVRDVPVSDQLAAILDYHLQHFAGVRFLIRLPGKDRPITQPVIQGWTRDAFGAVGLRYGREGEDGVTFHSTRHSFASWLAQNGFTTRVIAELIGDSPQEVDRTYAHLAPHNLQEAVAVVGRVSALP